VKVFVRLLKGSLEGLHVLSGKGSGGWAGGTERQCRECPGIETGETVS
jgi:hypothetical protein